MSEETLPKGDFVDDGPSLAGLESPVQSRRTATSTGPFSPAEADGQSGSTTKVPSASAPTGQAGSAPTRGRARRNRGRSRYPSRAGQSRVRKRTLWGKILSFIPVVLGVVCVISLVALGTMWWRGYFTSAHMPKVATDVSVSGELGAQPVLELNGQIPYTLQKTRVIITGTGSQIQEDSDIFLQISVYDGKTGQLENEKGLPRQYFGKANANYLGQEIFAAVLGQKCGSRLLVSRPVTVAGSDAVSMELDVIDVLPTTLSGDAEAIAANSPVTITDPGGSPNYTVEDKQADNASLYFQNLIVGRGQQIESNQTIIAQVGVWDFDTGAAISYTWNREKGPQLIDLSTTYRALHSQLADARVGSRVLFVIPAEEAKGDSSLVVVMDILSVANDNTMDAAERSQDSTDTQ